MNSNEGMVSTPSLGDADADSALCAICLGEKIDATLMEGCNHSFCLVCTSEWLNRSAKCPFCRRPVNSFVHKIHLPSHLRPTVTVAELRTAAAVAQLVARGRSLPPLNEKQCIRLRIRRLKKRLDTIQENMSRCPQDDQSSELASRTMRLIEEITSLETLNRETTTRFDIVSHTTFRSLIYEDNLEWSYIDRNPKCVHYSPEVFNANRDGEIERLLIFVDRELEIVWRSRRPNESQGNYRREYNMLVSNIVFWCSVLQINSTQFAQNLCLGEINPLYLERFQAELFGFASSMVLFEDFCNIITYSSRQLRRLQSRRNRGAPIAQEVVLSDEGDSDSAVTTTNADRNNGDIAGRRAF